LIFVLPIQSYLFCVIRDRQVVADVSPGYLRDLVPAEALEKGEHWKAVMTDIEKVIMPGVTHWASPHFHGYFPAGNSYPSIVADILSGAINCIGFSWIASPACTELEMLTMDWLATALNLPKEFLFADGSGKGGGVIQGSVSEATLVAMLSARTEQTQEGKIGIDNLVAYCSVEAHCSAERAGLLAGVKMRLIETDQNFSLRGEALKAAIEVTKNKA
jgi:aromatic-L-amino-acid decarboxylase